MTYEIKNKESFLELAVAEQDSIIEFLKSAVFNETLVSIQGDYTTYEEDGVDVDYVHLYGMYDNTVEWVSDYYQNGGMWEYSHPAELLAEFTKVEDTMYPVSHNVEDFDTPEFFYGNFDHLKPTIDKARKALIEINADVIKFYYRAELVGNEQFLNSDDVDDVFKLSTSEITWYKPEVVVSIFDTKIVWNSKYDNNQMSITVETDYNTKFQAFHDRASNHDSTIIA